MINLGLRLHERNFNWFSIVCLTHHYDRGFSLCILLQILEFETDAL